MKGFFQSEFDRYNGFSGIYFTVVLIFCLILILLVGFGLRQFVEVSNARQTSYEKMMAHDPWQEEKLK